MERNWSVEVLGVRGSFPAPEQTFLRYGGHTSCMLADCGGTQVLLDAGSGLARWGKRQMRTEKKRADILLSHLHLDHLMGLFAFPLLLDPGGEVHLYGMDVLGKGLSKTLETLMGPPYWPVFLRDFPARVEIHEIGPGESFRLGGQGADVTVRTCLGNHPGGSLWYRLEASGRSIVCALDCELKREAQEGFKAFSEDSDLLIWDAAFTAEDLERHRGWGHSSWEEGAVFGKSAGVKRVLMTHYASGYTDDMLFEEERKAGNLNPAAVFAREGMVIRL